MIEWKKDKYTNSFGLKYISRFQNEINPFDLLETIDKIELHINKMYLDWVCGDYQTRRFCIKSQEEHLQIKQDETKQYLKDLEQYDPLAN